MSDDALRYEPGDLLVDGDEDPADRASVVVLRYPRDDSGEVVPSREYEIEAIGSTVAQVNAAHPETDAVVEVAFEGWLDTHVGEAWRDLLRESERPFYDVLGDYCAEWGLPRQSYTYPESRLVPRPWCRECSAKADPVGAGGSYVCTTPDCANPHVILGEAPSALGVFDAGEGEP